MELIESQPLLEWLANNYKMFGATLEIITDKSQEGSQFVRGFGGIGGKYILTLFLTNINKMTHQKITHFCVIFSFFLLFSVFSNITNAVCICNKCFTCNHFG